MWMNALQKFMSAKIKLNLSSISQFFPKNIFKFLNSINIAENILFPK